MSSSTPWVHGSMHRNIDVWTGSVCGGVTVRSREARSAFGGEGGRLLNLTLDQRFRLGPTGDASDPARHQPVDRHHQHESGNSDHLREFAQRGAILSMDRVDSENIFV